MGSNKKGFKNQKKAKARNLKKSAHWVFFKNHLLGPGAMEFHIIQEKIESSLKSLKTASDVTAVSEILFGPTFLQV